MRSSARAKRGNGEVVPRRLTGTEEKELQKADVRMKSAEAEAARRRAERNQLILELLEDNVRAVDVADVLDMSSKGVRDARNRARDVSAETG